MQLPRPILIALIVATILWMLHAPVVAVLVDWLWFDALGYLGIFKTSLLTKAALWGVGAATAAIFMAVNLRIALRAAPIDTMRLGMILAEGNLAPQQIRTLIKVAVAACIVLPSLLFGTVASMQWLDMLAFKEQVPFGQIDPVFGLDIGFFVFELPMYEILQSFLVNLVVIVMIPTGLIYGLNMALAGQTPTTMAPRHRAHLLGLAAVAFLLVAVSWLLDRYGLLFEHNGIAWGVGYTDLHARMPAYLAMSVIAVACALALVAQCLKTSWRGPLIILGVYTVARIILGSAWPQVTQDYYVKPNELQLEREFIIENIAYTNSAYALDRIEVKPFTAESELTIADIEANPLTIDNVRVWDTRPLLTTYKQLQQLRLYYDFVDVDVDRYEIDGKLRQVMLSGRELNYQNVPAQAKSFINEHFQYTHGYGLTLSPVNVVLSNGMPELFVQDIPPVSPFDDFQIDQPEIYFGELTDRYVFVDTEAEEFDYPKGDANVYTQYAGKGGVGVGGLARKTLFSIWFKSFDIMLSNYIKPESRVLFRRQIQERVQTLTPFLQFDGDPYLVIADGRLVWIIDAYTTSNRYPYSEPVSLSRGRTINYIRNSVKLVVDAYHGSVDYYVADSEDALIRTYAKIFPGVFKSLDEMPETIKTHIRYPADFFDIQTTLYRAYHMADPTVFYNKEDMWDIPQELYGRQEQAMDSYTLIMKLPGEEQAEFILLMPFVPTRRDNMISWLAGRSDAPNYGKLVLYQFPKQKLIYGPRQIEARIDQDPAISELMTLWSQAGSRVVRGNLIVIPIEDNLMYVEPLYLQAETSQLPELKRIIVTYGDKIAMRQTLEEALLAVFDAAPQLPSDGVDQANPAASIVVSQNNSWQELATQAQTQFQEALSNQRAGNWAQYGAQLQSLESTLSKMSTLSEEAAAATDDQD